MFSLPLEVSSDFHGVIFVLKAFKVRVGNSSKVLKLKGVLKNRLRERQENKPNGATFNPAHFKLNGRTFWQFINGLHTAYKTCNSFV